MEATDLDSLNLESLTPADLETALVSLAKLRRRVDPRPTAWQTTALLRRIENALLCG